MLENMVQGTMYITTKHVCFHSTFWGSERKVRTLPVSIRADAAYAMRASTEEALAVLSLSLSLSLWL
jgi:hypothetical protein